MATKPILGNVTVGGAKKEMSGGYVNIGGAWKQKAKTYVNVNGVWKNAWKNLFTWKKYSVTNKTVYSAYEGTTELRGRHEEYITAGSGYTINANTGAFTLTGLGHSDYMLGNMRFNNRWSDCPYFYFVDDPSVLYKITRVTDADNQVKAKAYYVEMLISSTTSQTQGSYISDVTAETENAYPANGIHTDGYWYVKQ